MTKGELIAKALILKGRIQSKTETENKDWLKHLYITTVDRLEKGNYDGN